MAVTRTYNRQKVLVGQARPFIQPYNPAIPPALPANTIPLNGVWGGNWVELGATETGLEFDFQRKTKDIMIEEQSTPVQVTTVMTTFLFNLELAEDSLDTMQLAYGGGTITTVAAGVGTVGTRQLQIAADLTNFSFAFETQNEYGYWRRLLIPVVVSIAQAKTMYRRADKQRTYKCSFSSLVEPGQCTALEQQTIAL